MKRGDLVKFYSSHEPFQAEYRNKNPGIVLDVILPKSRNLHREWRDVSSAHIMWSDGSFSKEYITYLRAVES